MADGILGVLVRREQRHALLTKPFHVSLRIRQVVFSRRREDLQKTLDRVAGRAHCRFHTAPILGQGEGGRQESQSVLEELWDMTCRTRLISYHFYGSLDTGTGYSPVKHA
jgi:hypothetical protein